MVGMKRLFNLLVVGAVVAALLFPVLPQREQVKAAQTNSIISAGQDAKAAPTYPNLPLGLNYYQTTYPAGLRYSKEWYGTLTYAPKATVLMFDDDYTADTGMSIFAVSPAPQKQPSGVQGGTTLTAITREQADTIIKSYALDVGGKPFSPEIQAVMSPAHYFVGTWFGDKLTTKWNANLYERLPTDNLTDWQKAFITDTQGKTNKQVDLTKYDPNRYWVNGSGNWSDTTHWANASGNTSAGASVPTNADNTFFDANSFTGAGQTVTVDVAANTLSMDWTGATNTPTLAGTQLLIVCGSLTTISGMVWSHNGRIELVTGTGNVTTNGLTLACNIEFGEVGAAGNRTIADSLTTTGYVYNFSSVVTTAAGITVNCATFAVRSAVAKQYTFGAGTTINCTGWDMVTGGGAVTLTANTAIINISGTGVLAGGGANYNGATFNLNGTAHTLSGNFTVGTLSANSSKTQTITFTDGNVVSATTFNLSGSSGFQHTLQGSAAAGWAISQLAGTLTADYITISRSTANVTGGQIYNAVGGSVNGGNNVGWNFPLTIATVSASPVSMDKDGVSNVGLRGTIIDMGGSATVGAWFNYGLTAAYGSTTGNVTYSTTNFTGTKTNLTLIALTPAQTYHFQRAVTSGANTTYGADANFTLTMPSVTTGTASYSGAVLTLNGNITNMRAATSAYVRFNWGYDPGALTHSTVLQTINAITAFSDTITPLPQTIYYQAEVIVGAVSNYGSTEGYTLSGMNPSSFSLAQVLPIIAIMLILIFVIGLSVTSSVELSVIITIAIAIVLGLSFLGAVNAGIITAFGG